MDRVYRASGLGGCVKAQVAEQLGFTALDTSKRMENMAREGALHERAILSRLNEICEWDGRTELSGQQQEVTLPILKGVTIVGHLDGIANGSVIEVKSMGKDPYKVWKEKRWDTPGFVQKYKWQVSCYMQATVMPCTFIVKNRDTGEVSVEWVEDPFYGMD